MTDFQSVIESIRRRLEGVAGRLEALDRERADLQRESARLASTIEVLEQLAGQAAPPSSSDGSADPQPLTERVLAALVSGSARGRADLVRKFQPLGVNPNTVDSAVLRLRKRGVVRREGRRLVPVVQPSVPASPAESPRASSVGSEAHSPQGDLAPVAVDLDPGRAGLPGTVSVPEDSSLGVAPAPADRVPLTVRVLEAVATSLLTTRADLVRRLGAQGVEPSAVDAALAGLRRRGKLQRGPDGVLAVVGDADAVPGNEDPAPGS